ncbi:MAG: SRPBCC family protein [Firmicutes bacterium]|jgi:hypothetical protein|nr:SRPBCC family protein [Bacillota bacterium]
MKVSSSVHIDGSREEVWKVISDIEHANENISAIEKIEILEEAGESLEGLKWRETRKMFGREATEVMWVSDSEENYYYETLAKSHGMAYVSKMTITDDDSGETLTMEFHSTPMNFWGRLGELIFGRSMTTSLNKSIKQDLEDIKHVVERMH